MSNKRGKLKLGSLIIILLGGLIIFPPLSRAVERSPVRPIVVIDPAHGGADKGVKISDSEYEKDITLKIALALQKELQTGGNILVRLTRTSDADLPTAERTKVVRSSGAKIFVSLHINAGFGKKAAGYEVYFPGFGTAAENKNAAAEIIKDMEGNKHLNDSVALAQSIRRNMQNVFPRKDRDLRAAPFIVLEGLSLPAVVVEIGFATNTDDKKIITEEKGRRAIALALSKSIKEFLH